MNSRLFLTKILGSWAGLIQGDMLTWDRWRWLRPRLPKTGNGERLLDVGCGTGAFTICAAQRGYAALGLTWNKADRSVAEAKTILLGRPPASFEDCDVRLLDQAPKFANGFDVILCCENIEHIMDDDRLARAMFGCLKDRGRLLLTAPNFYYRPITKEDQGPFSRTEDGWHVRRGYTKAAISEVLNGAGFTIETVEYCGGICAQKATGILRQFKGRGYWVGWILTIVLRPMIPIADCVIHKLIRYPRFSICVEAHKPRLVGHPQEK